MFTALLPEGNVAPPAPFVTFTTTYDEAGTSVTETTVNVAVVVDAFRVELNSSKSPAFRASSCEVYVPTPV